MIVKRAFHLLLFLTILYAENVNGIYVQNIDGANANVTVTTTTPSTSHKTSIDFATSTTKPTVIQNETKTSSKANHTEPVLINHDRASPSTSTTTKPFSTSTLQPSTTAKSVLISSTPSVVIQKSGSDDNETSSGKISTTSEESAATQPTTSSPSTTTNSSVTFSMERKNGHSKTTAAGIVALTCVTIASFAFVALIAWRYVYRKRHGNREILINEEDVDFNDEDLRHFEATCIQLEPDA